MILTRDGCQQNIKFLISSLDPEWLHDELKRIMDYSPKNKPTADYESQFHPLALQIHFMKEHMEICRNDPSRKLTQEILDLAILGSNIKYFKKMSKGIDSKIDELMSSNYENFEKTVYEFNVARGFAEVGYLVDFVKREIDKKTHDLMLNDKIEVECKKKNSRTLRNIQIHEFWKFLKRKSEKMMKDYNTNFLISILFYDDPKKRSH